MKIFESQKSRFSNIWIACESAFYENLYWRTCIHEWCCDIRHCYFSAPKSFFSKVVKQRKPQSNVISRQSVSTLFLGNSSRITLYNTISRNECLKQILTRNHEVLLFRPCCRCHCRFQRQCLQHPKHSWTCCCSGVLSINVGKYCGKKIGDTKVIFYLLYHMCGIVHGRLFGQNNKCLDHGHRR